MACKEENMAKKTNKTSHVLNLITGGSGDPEPDARQTQDPMQTEQNVVVVDSEEEERIAEDIRRQLLKEMGGDMPAPDQAAPAPEEESQETESVREGTEAAQTAIPDPVTGPAAAGSSEASAVSKTTSPVQEEKADSEEKTEAETEKEELPYRMVNVMEEILSPEMVKEEMKKYGVCLCSRCQADVLALLLTRLPAKYIVANTPAIPPLLSYYKNKYRVNLLTQMIKACLDVRENPRHDRKEPYDSKGFADN